MQPRRSRIEYFHHQQSTYGVLACHYRHMLCNICYSV